MIDKVVLRDVFSVMKFPDYVQVVGEPSGDNVVNIEFQYPIRYGDETMWARREYDTRCSIESPSSTTYFAGHVKFVVSMPWSGARQAQHMGDPVRNIGIIFGSLSGVQITKEEFELPLDQFTFPTT